MGKRNRRLGAGLTALAVIGLVVYAGGIAPRWLRVLRLRVGVPGLPSEWDGVRVAHLSDLHVGALGVGLPLLLRARAEALAFTPDIIALTGDYYQDGVPTASGDLYAAWPSTASVLAVLGNHDFRGGPANLCRVERELAAGGARLLRNDALALELRGRRAWIVGVDDPFTLRSDEDAAFSQAPDGEDVLLCLAHSPAVATTLPVGRARIVLSGHTHGGQLRLLPSGRLPFLGLLRRLMGAGERREPSRFRGWWWERGALVIVSDGLGLSQLPARFRTRPQVLLLELVSAPAEGAACDDARRYVRVLNPERWFLRWLE